VDATRAHTRLAAEQLDQDLDGAGGQSCDLTVVVPMFNEIDNVDPALDEILGVVSKLDLDTEVIVVDDGSTDGTAERLAHWAGDPRVRVIRFRRNFGQTAAISAGFDHARGRRVVLIDGDQQNDPADIPRMLSVMDQGFDVVSGWRANRQDKLLLRRIPSGLANRLISRITGTRLHDYGCTLKVYDAEVVRHLRLYGELHRFIPALAAMSGAKVEELAVNHRPRTRGTSKYGISRTVRVVLDLITVKFLLSYLARPMQFFGRLGLGAFGLAVASALMIPVQRLSGVVLLKGQTFSLMVVLATVVAVQFVCMGLLGELLTRIYHEGGMRKSYVVRNRSGFDTSRPDRTLPVDVGLLTSPSLDHASSIINLRHAAGDHLDPIAVDELGDGVDLATIPTDRP
jgi:glycosyltransferase involved in cell wall biosynthesis